MVYMRPIIVALVISMAIPAGSHAAGDWKLVKNTGDIQVYTMPVEGSDMDAFKGVAVIPAPVESLAAVLSDVPAQPRWMASCTEARIIKQLGENSVLIYRVTKAPWPVYDRDMVIISSTTVEPGGGRIVASFKITDNHGVPPRDRMVRMKEMRGQWILERLSPEETRVTLEVQSNPGGSIPPSIANSAGIDIPYKTLQGLRRIVREPKYQRR